MKIITLTLSPAFDVHLSVPNFAAERENLVEASTRDIGGKGINISRALTENGVSNISLVVLGNENSEDFLRGMDACGLNERITLNVDGRIRENMTVHPENAPETRISFKGFRADEGLLDRVFSLIAPDSDTVVTFTGSLPGGITDNETEDFLRRIVDSGAKLVIDSKSVPLDMLKRINPWLIKPNSEELAAYLGELDFDGIVKAASELHRGGIVNALISLGGDGSVLACDEGIFKVTAPKINVVSTIGAGDSMIAGFIAAMEGTAEERLRTATAFGSAACLTEGTNPPTKENVARLSNEVIIEKITEV